MLLMRSAIALTTMVVWLNCGLKKAVWNGIKRDQISALIFRSTQGAVTNIISYSCTKYLPLTVIAIISNLGPSVTVVLAYMVLKEKIKGFEMVIMFLSLAATIVFSLFGNAKEDKGEATSSLPIWVFYAALAVNPILSSSGTIAMRKMKKFHEAVVSWYLNWVLLLTSVAFILI